ncbi:hypothetical protein [Arthrobacter gengyunqii]|uniref:Uncharacterized protein n=1 Tax=Arthrobacter gengyunqii TaxID=2886940 RepID=A0ABS8GLQ6_9MICC|nr:hypothetical protein [Arthrobacter gengyunqii]MCC3267607.1 hypothetical protein [Arthrobacter gengyunqii]
MANSTDIPEPSSNYRPGEPLREWEDTRTAGIDLALTIQGAQAGDALVRLINGEELSKDDIIAFGRLNAMAVQVWYEPLINLLGPNSPWMPPKFVELVRKHTGLFAQQ